MHILLVLAAIAALSAQLASATCYPGGTRWGDKDDARKKLVDACSRELIGDYGPLGDRKACRPGRGISGTGSYEFEIRNENKYGVHISQNDCVEDLGREIQYCEYGGRETVGAILMREVARRQRGSTEHRTEKQGEGRTRNLASDPRVGSAVGATGRLSQYTRS
ncbi:MAG: hypothetical protein Q9169_008161 [Polycauliona sp. 2 TL-2023]